MTVHDCALLSVQEMYRADALAMTAGISARP